MKLPESLFVDVSLQVEQGAYQFELTGSGEEYCARFPSLLSAIHFAFAFWPMRKWVPEGITVRLVLGPFSYRYRPPSMS